MTLQFSLIVFSKTFLLCLRKKQGVLGVARKCLEWFKSHVDPLPRARDRAESEIFQLRVNFGEAVESCSFSRGCLCCVLQFGISLQAMVVYRKKDARRAIRFTVLVTGPQGTGKTSFVNSLLDQNILPHRYQGKTHGKTIPKTITYSNLSSINASEAQYSFDASNAHKEPGIAITETSVEIVDEDESKIQLTVIDTPGFGDNLDNSICVKEICNFLEQQFDFVLAEETKVRRNPRFEDTRVHVCLYFIEPTGHGLRELDVESMIKFSKYVNVMPVIARADSFTKHELANFKRNILQDIERFKIPVFQFQTDEYETDEEIIQESKYLSQLQPFAIITSDDEEIVNGKKTRVRKYPWGTIDINDTAVSDFPVLKSVLLGSQLQEFKDITHDFLYEAYRTEKLSSVADLKNDFTDSIPAPSHLGLTTDEPPSMSNLAEIANSTSMNKFDIPQRSEVEAVANKLANSTIEEQQEGHDNSSEYNDTVSRHSKRYSMDSQTSETSHTTLNRPNTSRRSATNSPQISARSEFQVPQANIDPKKLRKISETVPYMLRHETLRSKQSKLEELERQSALELSRRAAELERKTKELKMREALLKERLAQRESAISTTTAGSIKSTDFRESVVEEHTVVHHD